MIIKPKYLWRVRYVHESDCESTHYYMADTVKDAISEHHKALSYEYTEIVQVKRVGEVGN